MITRFALLFLLLFVTPVELLQAQADTETFKIRVYGGSDTEAPTTPVIFAATPITYSQIDVSWSASTDNFAVAGYSILRDGVAVATTSLTNYSDTGLAASTTYQYEVRAFDYATNYSSTSAAVLATTPGLPVVPPVIGDEATEGTAARVVLKDIKIQTGITKADFDITVARPARLELRWGRTSSYELGYVTSDTYVQQRSVNVTELEPDTTYEYQLIGYTPSGVKTILKQGQFTTLGETTGRPENIKRFIAVPDGKSVRLSWQLPAGDDVSSVRIVRSHFGFPSHPQDGAIVYQGLQTSIVDSGILNQYSPVYYTAFTYDEEGNVSSGAVAIVYAQNERAGDNNPTDRGSVDTESNITKPLGEVILTDSPTTTVDTNLVSADMNIPSLEDIEVVQGDTVFTLANESIFISHDHPFTVRIAKEAVSKNLKSIIVTILDPTDNRLRYSFLLRINNNQTAYEATIAPLGVTGHSRLIVEIFDYQANIVSTYQGPITFIAIDDEVVPVLFPDVFVAPSKLILLAIALPFALALILLLIYRFRTEDNE